MNRLLIFILIFIFSACGDAELIEETVEIPTTIKATTTSTTSTTLTTTTTSTLPDVMPTVLITCEPVESLTMLEGFMRFNFEITTGTNELVVLNIVTWFDSSRTDDLFIYDGLPSPGSSNEFGIDVDDIFSQYEIEIVVMDSKDNFANDYCLYEQNPDASNPSTTTTTTVPPSTTTTTTVPPSTTEIKLPNEPNQFPEIPYCEMSYDDVEEQLNNFFISNNIKITIREYVVKTPNIKCHGFVSGSNFSYLDFVNSGDLIEITVEGTEDKRKFPTTIANIENSMGNEEFFYLYCDLKGLPITDKFWYGELLQPYKIRDYVIYSQPNYLNVNLNDPLTNCAEEISLEDLCYWRVEYDNGSRVYRHYSFDAVNHYASSELYDSGADIFNSCSDLQGLKDGYVASDVDGEY